MARKAVKKVVKAVKKAVTRKKAEPKVLTKKERMAKAHGFAK